MKKNDYLLIASCSLASLIGVFVSFFIIFYHFAWIRSIVGAAKDWQDFFAAMVTLGVGGLAYYAVMRQIGAEKKSKEEDQKCAAKIIDLWAKNSIEELQMISRILKNIAHGSTTSLQNSKDIVQFLESNILEENIIIADVLIKCNTIDAQQAFKAVSKKRLCQQCIRLFADAVCNGEPVNRLIEAFKIFEKGESEFVTEANKFINDHAK